LTTQGVQEYFNGGLATEVYVLVAINCQIPEESEPFASTLLCEKVPLGE